MGLVLMAPIIDAEKLQNEKFLQRNWLIIRNGNPLMLVLNEQESAIEKSIKQYNAIGKALGQSFVYKEVRGLKYEAIEK
jgi:hypothetical protein